MPAHGYGWVKQKPDHRDYLYQPSPTVVLPRSVDLRPQMPPVYDQGQLGSCTANAIGAAWQYDQIKQALPAFTPSRLAIYYAERAMEGTVSEDAGAELRDGIKVVVNQGVVSDADWPYDIAQFRTPVPPTLAADALQNTALVYRAVPQDMEAMMACLADGYPFVFGFTVYESFESAAVAGTGIVPLPQPDEQALGGHAVMCVGYTDATDYRVPNCWIVRNSWGAGWGEQGYCYMPIGYLLSPTLASDFWTISTVQEHAKPTLLQRIEHALGVGKEAL